MSTFWTEKTDGLREELIKPSMLNWKTHLWTEEVVSGITFPAPTMQHYLSSPGSFTIIHTLDPVTKTRPFRQVDTSEVIMTPTTCTLVRGFSDTLDCNDHLCSYADTPHHLLLFRTEEAFRMRGETSSRSEKNSSCPDSSSYDNHDLDGWESSSTYVLLYAHTNWVQHICSGLCGSH